MYFKAVSKIEIGACGADGAMGGTLVDYRQHLKSQTFKLAGLKSNNKHRVYRDGSDTPVVSKAGTPDPLTANFELLYLSRPMLEIFLGGTINGTSGAYEHPSGRFNVERSVKITGEAENGEQFELSIPRAAMACGLVGGASQDNDEIVSLSVDLECLTPIDGSGNELSPFQVDDALEA